MRRILSDPKNAVVVLHCVHEITPTAPWKCLTNKFQRRCCPRGEYTVVLFRRCIKETKDLHQIKKPPSNIRKKNSIPYYGERLRKFD